MKHGLFVALACIALLTSCQQQNQQPPGYAHFPMGVSANGQSAANDPYSQVDVFFEKNCNDPQVDVRVVSQGVYRGTYEELEKLNFIGSKLAESRMQGCSQLKPTTMNLSAREKDFNGAEKYNMAVNEHGKYLHSSIAYEVPQPTPAAPPSVLEQVFSNEENFNKAMIGLMIGPVVFCNQNPNHPSCQASPRGYSSPRQPEEDEPNTLAEDIEMYEPIEEPYYAPPPPY